MSRKLAENLKKDWHQYPDVKRVRAERAKEKTILIEVEPECVEVMRANGGAPHYM